MKHIGIVAHSAEGAALCYRTICQEGFRILGPHQHPEVTMDGPLLCRRVLEERWIGCAGHPGGMHRVAGGKREARRHR